LSRGTPLRGLARVDAAAKVDWRQTEAWGGVETRRADLAPLTCSRGQRRRAVGHAARHSARFVVSTDARTQTEDARYGGARQQAGPCRLGTVGEGRRLQGSGCGRVKTAVSGV